jgi:hypothetical protein
MSDTALLVFNLVFLVLSIAGTMLCLVKELLIPTSIWAFLAGMSMINTLDQVSKLL